MKHLTYNKLITQYNKNTRNAYTNWWKDNNTFPNNIKAEEILAKYNIVYGPPPEYHISSNVITLPHKRHFRSEEDFYLTALHEVAHATMKPLNRNLEKLKALKDEDIHVLPACREEIIAEIAAWKLSLLCGISVGTMSITYIRAKHRLHPSISLRNCFTLANKAVKYIIAQTPYTL